MVNNWEDGLTIAWGVVPRGITSGGFPLGQRSLFVWKESHAFLDGSAGERSNAPDVFVRQGSTEFL